MFSIIIMFVNGSNINIVRIILIIHMVLVIISIINKTVLNIGVIMFSMILHVIIMTKKLIQFVIVFILI